MRHVQKETAVLLKEKGFDVEVRNRYYDTETISIDGGLDNYNRYKTLWLSAPTLHEATDWLRAKGVHVDVSPSVERNKWVSFVYVLEDGRTVMVEKAAIASTHDLALEAGIVHALKHYIK